METNDTTKKGKASIKNYKDLEGMSTQNLTLGLWFVENRKNFRLLAVILLSTIAGISWSYTIFNFAVYVTKGMNDDNAVVASINKLAGISHSAVLRSSAVDLGIEPAYALRSADNKFDFFSQVSNPNQKYWAEFSYYFVSGNSQTEKINSFIMPGENKYLLALAQKIEPESQSIELKMDNLVWHRIDAHKISNYEDFKNSHLNTVVSDIKFSADNSNNPSGSSFLNSLGFNAANNTAFNYAEINFIIVLKSGADNVAAVNNYGLANFMSGDKKNIGLVWAGNLPPVSEVLIQPEVNIFKSDSYKNY